MRGGPIPIGSQMKRKRYILLLLAALTVAIPTFWGYRTGVRRADAILQEHADRDPNSEQLRAHIVSHSMTGGFLVGSFIVVYFVVAQAFIRVFGLVFNGACSGIGWLARKATKRTEHSSSPRLQTQKALRREISNSP